MKKIFLAACAAATTIAAAPAMATTFDFTSGNPASWTADGITLKVTGWSTNGGTPMTGAATPYSGYGYGVINADSDNSHTIDNSGYADFVRLEFSKAVTLTGVALAAFGDTDAWISYGDVGTNMTSTTGWASFLRNGVEFAGGTSSRVFAPGIGGPSTVWLVGAGRSLAAGNDDSFKLAGVAVSAVPEPATWGMMILGFGMAGSAMRYRRRQAKVTFA